MKSTSAHTTPLPGPLAGTAALDRDTREQLLAAQVDKLFNAVFCMLGNHQDAEDVIQDVYLKAHEGLDEFRGDAALSTWLYTIAMNAARAHLRKKSRGLRVVTGLSEQELELLARADDETGPVERRFEEKELGTALRKALMNLPAEFREVFVLRQFEDKSYRDIARILGISMGTVESRMYRAREKLRKDLWPHMQRSGSDGHE